MQEAGISEVLAMGCRSLTPDDAPGIAGTLRLSQDVAGLHAIAVADPTRTDVEHLSAVESALATRQAVALKGYLGYLPFPPDYAGYRPYYEMAERCKVPFIFHTGDTYSPRARLRCAQPLLVDDVAVDHPEVRFVIAHLGNPWMTDAAEVVYKNVNVWADVSGLVVGPLEAFTGAERKEMLFETQAALGRAFRYTERPNRFLFGSDWPLVPMSAYRDFIRGAIPEAHHAQVFGDNARVLFRL
jgi:uncharacterized protein